MDNEERIFSRKRGNHPRECLDAVEGPPVGGVHRISWHILHGMTSWTQDHCSENVIWETNANQDLRKMAKMSLKVQQRDTKN